MVILEPNLVYDFEMMGTQCQLYKVTVIMYIERVCSSRTFGKEISCTGLYLEDTTGRCITARLIYQTFKF